MIGLALAYIATTVLAVAAGVVVYLAIQEITDRWEARINRKQADR